MQLVIKLETIKHDNHETKAILFYIASKSVTGFLGYPILLRYAYTYFDTPYQNDLWIGHFLQRGKPFNYRQLGG